jgi:cytosine/adenosine deaminase-related metal-dependent hydrolase
MAIDLWEEARAIELDERLVSGVRGRLAVPALADALTGNGATSLGWDAGRIAPGALADLVTVRLDSPRTAGARAGAILAHVVFAATAADVTHVFVGGHPIVADGVHYRIADVGRELDRAIWALLAPAAGRRR